MTIFSIIIKQIQYNLIDLFSPASAALQAAASNSYNWEKFFEALQQNYETPTLIWNEALRHEMVFAIGQELAAVDQIKESNPGKKFTWNCEEFTIKYMSIANELKVGEYYINIFLKRLPNVMVSRKILRKFFEFLELCYP